MLKLEDLKYSQISSYIHIKKRQVQYKYCTRVQITKQVNREE